MEEEGGELLHAVEDEAVLPHHHGVHEGAHAEHVVGLEIRKYQNVYLAMLTLILCYSCPGSK